MEVTGGTSWDLLREGFCLGPDTVKSAVPLECFSVYGCLLKAAVESLPFFSFNLYIYSQMQFETFGIEKENSII